MANFTSYINVGTSSVPDPDSFFRYPGFFYNPDLDSDPGKKKMFEG